MKANPLRASVVVVNPLGLHMRPATAFAKSASRYESRVSVWLKERSVDGKSLLDLMMLAAEPGTELIVEVDGADAADALPVLVEILASPGDGQDPQLPPKG
jgi:phosphotransferase system HPr (HPr) family protein